MNGIRIRGKMRDRLKRKTPVDENKISPESIILAGQLEKSTIFNNRAKMLVGLVVLIATFGYFAFMAFESATVYYYTVGELHERGTDGTDDLVRVNGKLVPNSFQRDGESVLAYFSLTDGTEMLSAVHSGIVPDLFFNDHSEIILEGTYTIDGVFHSENIIVKCPSKYVAKGST
ncbi:cytochrome c maturation protein CcmE [Dehalococcoidia bacterium]|nr:cytochrome c maturation protein CcmE [Dehalococcoidia bacterium]